MLETIYDVNNPGNLFHSSIYDRPINHLDDFVGILPASDPPPAALASQPTLLSQVANFFRPRRTLPFATIPTQANCHFGNIMPVPIPPTTTRLYFINLNGINLEKESTKFRDLCEDLRKADIQLFAASEHNLDTNKFAVRKKLQDTARRSFSHYSLESATSSIPAAKFYKPGGTLLLAQGDIVGRI